MKKKTTTTANNVPGQSDGGDLETFADDLERYIANAADVLSDMIQEGSTHDENGCSRAAIIEVLTGNIYVPVMMESHCGETSTTANSDTKKEN